MMELPNIDKVLEIYERIKRMIEFDKHISYANHIVLSQANLEGLVINPSLYTITMKDDDPQLKEIIKQTLYSIRDINRNKIKELVEELGKLGVKIDWERDIDSLYETEEKAEEKAA
jgi:hypothetical protein